jgi:histidinol-phosphate aminotransferase
MSFLNRIKPGIRALEPYSVKGRAAPIKLNQNENPFDIPTVIKEKVLAQFAREQWNRYPETFPQDLTEAFARYHRYPAEGIIVSNGSNELMYTILMAIVTKGTPVLLPSPAFFLYEKAAKVLDATVVNIMMNDDLSYNAGRFIEAAAQHDPALIVIVSPNSPTAQSMSYGDVERILSETRALVLVDEAYIEFSDKKSCFDLLEKYQNLIILRTLSKSFSLAGLRIGYLLAHPEIRNEILKPKIPFTVNRFSALTAMTLLDHLDIIHEHIDYIKLQRRLMETSLRTIPGLTLYQSDTNFFLFRTDRPASDLMDALLNKGILIRDVSSYPMLDRCLRVNIGTEEENEQFVDTLRRVLQ